MNHSHSHVANVAALAHQPDSVLSCRPRIGVNIKIKSQMIVVYVSYQHTSGKYTTVVSFLAAELAT